MNAGLPATMACRHKDNSSAISNLITHSALNHAVQKKKVMYAMLREGGEQQAGPPGGAPARGKTYGSTFADRMTTGLLGTFW
ncbi:hypothetical protein EDC48_113108 [Gibbsiella quercinecans]|nr:hypothetical protein EDC48_113108 [Gibbsiella quercinecans]